MPTYLKADFHFNPQMPPGDYLEFTDDDLLPGWEMRIDSRSGREFYVNHYRKITTWVNPTEDYIRDAILKSKLPAGWDLKTHESTGKRYYVDHNTKTTTWSHPCS